MCAAVCVLSVSCGREQGYVGAEKHDFGNITVEIPKFKGFGDNAFEKELNQSCEKDIDERIRAFSKESGEDGKFELKQEIKRNKAPAVSVVGEIYAYTGGVRGTYERIVKNIDVVKNEELELPDLFEDGAYKDKLNTELEKTAQNNPEEYSDLWKKPQISDDCRADFYLTDKELVIFYPPYELSYFSKGFVEFSIPYENIKGYLKEEYKNL